MVTFEVQLCFDITLSLNQNTQNKQNLQAHLSMMKSLKGLVDEKVFLMAITTIFERP